MATSAGFTCSICLTYTSSNINAVLRHIGSIHSHEPGFLVRCGISGCSRTYSNYHSFRKHIRRKHYHSLALEENLESNVNDATVSDTERFNDTSTTQEEETESMSGVQEGLVSMKQKSAILFTLKCKEVRQISQLALNDLLGDVSIIVQQTVDSLQSKVTNTLRQKGLPTEELSQIFIDEDLRAPFKCLESSYMQKKAYTSLGLVVSYY